MEKSALKQKMFVVCLVTLFFPTSFLLSDLQEQLNLSSLFFVFWIGKPY